MPQGIDSIDKQIEQLKARRHKLLARETATQRKERTRQAIVVGSWIIEHRPQWADEVRRSLVRPQDRAVFGLSPVSRGGLKSGNERECDISL